MRASRLLATYLFWATASLVSAQDASAPGQQPVFRGGVDLVTLDVRVVDKDGKPVSGLSAADFVVTLNGQPRPVRALDYLTFGPAAVGSTAVSEAPGHVPAPASRGGRVILFMFDDLSARPLQAKELTVAAERLLPTLDPSDLVGLATTSGRGPTISPTRDRAAVLAGLHSKALVGLADQRPSPFVTVNEAIEIRRDLDQTVFTNVTNRECGTTGSQAKAAASNKCPSMVRANALELSTIAASNTADQMAAFAHAIEALRAAPAPRVLVALTCGLAMSPYEPAPLDAVSRAAAEADVAFYALVTPDETGLDLSDSNRRRAQARVEESVFLVGNTEALAEAAGGQAFRVIGQPDRFLTQIVTEASALYRLGIEAPPGADRNADLTVKVALKDPTYVVHTNVHALRPMPVTPAAPVSPAEGMRARLAQGGAAFGVPIRLAARLRREPVGAHLQVIVGLDVPAATPGPLTTMFALLNSAGAIVQSGQKALLAAPGSDYRLALPLTVDEGDYHLRVVIADVNGNIGSIDQPLVAHLHRLGPFAASDLLLMVAGEGADPHLLTTEDLPAHASILSVALELYADPLPADVTVHLALTAAGGGPVVVDADRTPTSDGGRLVVSTDFPAGDLPVGAYVLTATVLQSGQAVGTLSANLRKVE